MMRDTFSQSELELMVNAVSSTSPFDDAKEDIDRMINRTIARVQMELVPLIVEVENDIQKMYDSEEEALQKTLQDNPNLERTGAMERVAACLDMNERLMRSEIEKIRYMMQNRIMAENYRREKRIDEAREYFFYISTYGTGDNAS